MGSNHKELEEEEKEAAEKEGAAEEVEEQEEEEAEWLALFYQDSEPMIFYFLEGPLTHPSHSPNSQIGCPWTLLHYHHWWTPSNIALIVYWESPVRLHVSTGFDVKSGVGWFFSTEIREMKLD